MQGIRFQQSARDVLTQLSIMDQTTEVTKLFDAKLAKQQQATMQRLYARYMAQGGTMPQQ